jgi:hypothetical protein
MITRELQSWTKPDTDDDTVGDSEERAHGTTLDLRSFFFYSTLGAVSFLILWQLYLKCRDTHSVAAEIPEPQARSQGEEVVKKRAGERRKELLAGFEEHKVQRVSKLKIDKKLYMNVIPHAATFSFLDYSFHLFRKCQRRI